MQERKLDERPEYRISTGSRVASNYYPVTSAIAIRDQNRKKQFILMNERTQGGSSLGEGSVELM